MTLPGLVDRDVVQNAEVVDGEDGNFRVDDARSRGARARRSGLSRAADVSLTSS